MYLYLCVLEEINLEPKRMGDSWSCLTCLGAEEPPPRRRVINKDMIGLPANFQHTGHIGSNDYGASDMNSIQNQMESKGGYESSMPVPSEHTPHGIDVVVSLREAP